MDIKKFSGIHGQIVDFIGQVPHVSSLPVSGFCKNNMRWTSSFTHKIRGDTEVNKNVAYVDLIDHNNMVLSEYCNLPYFKSMISPQAPDALSGAALEVSDKTYGDLSDQPNNNGQILYVNPVAWAGVEYQEFSDTSPDHEKTAFVARHNFGVCPAFYTVCKLLAGVYDNTISYELLQTSSFRVGAPMCSSIRVTSNDQSVEVSFSKFNNQTPPANPSDRIVLSVFVEPTMFRAYSFHSPQALWLANLTANNCGLYDHLQSLFVTDVNNVEKDISGSVDGESVFFAPQIKSKGKATPPSIHVSFPGDAKESGSLFACNNDKFIIRIPGADLSTDGDSPAYKSPYGFYSKIHLFRDYHKCYSATQTTYPYHQTEAIDGGTIVEYSFVDSNGNTPKFSHERARPPLFLKIKSTPGFIKKLNKKLGERVDNPDIINHITFNLSRGYSIRGGYTGKIASYFRFGETYYYRSDFDIDHVLESESGTEAPPWSNADGSLTAQPSRLVFAANEAGDLPGGIPGFNPGKYDKCVVAGISEISNSRYKNKPTYRMYLTNHNSTNDVYSWKEFNIIQNHDDFQMENVTSGVGEVFRPMILHPGMGGYIKILKQASHSTGGGKALQGTEEAMYEIEVPFCAGNWNLRRRDSGRWFKGCVYATSKYMPAGSEEKTEGGYKKIHNARPLYSCAELIKNPEVYANMYHQLNLFPDALKAHPSSTVYALGAVEKLSVEAPDIRQVDSERYKDFMSIDLRVSGVKSAAGVYNDVVLAFTPNTPRYYDKENLVKGEGTPGIVGEFSHGALDDIAEVQDPKPMAKPPVKRHLSVSAHAKASSLNLSRDTSSIYGEQIILNKPPSGVCGELYRRYSGGSANQTVRLSGKDFIWKSSENPNGYVVDKKSVPVIIEGYNEALGAWERVSESTYDFLQTPKTSVLKHFEIAAISQQDEIPGAALATIQHYDSPDQQSLDYTFHEFDYFARSIKGEYIDNNIAPDLHLYDTFTQKFYPLLNIWFANPDSGAPYVEANVCVKIEHEEDLALSVRGRYHIVYKKHTGGLVKSVFGASPLHIGEQTHYFDRFNNPYSIFRVRPKLAPKTDIIPVRGSCGEFDMRPVVAAQADLDVSDSLPIKQEGALTVYAPDKIVYNGVVSTLQVNNFKMESK